MNVAAIFRIGEESRSRREESLRSSLTESEIFDRVVDLVPEATDSGAFPHGVASALRRFDVGDEDVVAVVGGLPPFITVPMLRAMRTFFGSGDEVCVTVRRMVQPHPVNAFELYRSLRSFPCKGDALREGVSIADRGIVRRLEEGGEIVLRLYDLSEDYDLLREDRYLVRGEPGMVRCFPSGKASPDVDLAVSRPENVTIRTERVPAVWHGVDFLVRDGEPDFEVPFVIPELWSFINKSSLKINRLTGERIQGRQQYPEVFAVEPLVAMGRLRDLREYPALLRAGKVRGFPFDDRWEGMDIRMWRRFAGVAPKGAAWIS